MSTQPSVEVARVALITVDLGLVIVAQFLIAKSASLVAVAYNLMNLGWVALFIIPAITAMIALPISAALFALLG